MNLERMDKIESKKNLLRTFYISLGDEKEDLTSIYRSFFKNQQQKPNDLIYHKWMPLPEKDFGYILNVSKHATSKKLNDILTKCTYPSS